MDTYGSRHAQNRIHTRREKNCEGGQIRRGTHGREHIQRGLYTEEEISGGGHTEVNIYGRVHSRRWKTRRGTYTWRNIPNRINTPKETFAGGGIHIEGDKRRRTQSGGYTRRGTHTAEDAEMGTHGGGHTHGGGYTEVDTHGGDTRRRTYGGRYTQS